MNIFTNYENSHKVVLFLLIVATTLSLIIALYPETKAVPLTFVNKSTINAPESSKIKVTEVAQQFQNIRQSVISQNGDLIRNWTPDQGIVQLNYNSNTFNPARYMSVTITGSSYSKDGLISIFIECLSNAKRIEVFKGSVNTNISETLISTPINWCAGNAHLTFKTEEKGTYVGVGMVYEISFISYIKSTFIGKLIYFVLSAFIFSVIMLAGSTYLIQHGWTSDPLPLAFLCLGALSLLVFYSASYIRDLKGLGVFIILFSVFYLIRNANREIMHDTFNKLKSYLGIWLLVSFFYFVLLSLSYSGLGHWEPTYRFWPASWSSDGELSWLFTEAIHNGWNLEQLFGGQWLPSDRPPLMSGTFLFLTDIFKFLQQNNDGYYLRGSTYNTASILLNTLWVPVIWWLLSKTWLNFNLNQKLCILLFLTFIPFIIFNSIYGWPKFLGASFALLAFGLCSENCLKNSPQKNIAAFYFFPLMCALSMLSHMSTAIFLLPLTLLFIYSNITKNLKHLFCGGIVGFGILATWLIYKATILPSNDPVTKFALTGSFGFGDSSTLIEMLKARYEGMTFIDWLSIKKLMFIQPFLPIDNSITNIPLNNDSGASFIGQLRAWDFMLLSKGNIAVIVCLLTCCFSFTKKQAPSNKENLFFLLVMVSLISWILITLAFVAPLVIHHWPQAALFGLALGGIATTCHRYPLIFYFLFITTISYTTAVWIIDPLSNSVSIDTGAAVALSIILFMVLSYRKRPELEKSNNTKTNI